MAELLVMAVSNTNKSDALSDAEHWKRGDVIEVRADGWGWGTSELTSEKFRIIRVPGLITSKQEALMSQPLNEDMAKGIKRRLRTLDFAALPAGVAKSFSPPRSGPYIDMTVSRVDSITELKS